MIRPPFSIIVLYLLVGCQSVMAQSEQTEFFESRIRPVLIEHCYECHNSAGQADGELALDHKQAMQRGGERGKIIVPGNAAESLLIAILRHEVDGLEMPENGPKLDDKIVDDFERWINDGAMDPRKQPPSEADINQAISWDAVRERRKQWWSFQPITKSPSPRPGHVVDAFIDQRLQITGLQPAPQAQTATLVRRLFFVLTGLPPSRQQAESWTTRIREVANADRMHVVNQLIDELLDSPRFGEHWARHWMDWIRYAESHGSEGDPRINNAWMYRDYLIRALNQDVPYDQLVREHIAGDLLPNPRINEELGINESILGPIHWRMVFHGFAPTDALDERVRFTDDQINAFSKAFLGVTVSCARCHDHKFDAISQKDYYALFGVLSSCRPARAVIDLPNQQMLNQSELEKLKPSIRSAVAEDWLGQLDRVALRINELKPKGTGDNEKGPKSPLAGLVFQFNKNPDAWSHRVQRHKSTSRPETSASHRWDLSKQADYNTWYPKGVGLGSAVSKAGEFAIAIDGKRALTGIYPSGVYSNLISSKHAARLTSPTFQLGEKNELWVQVIGEKQSRVRYVVQNYPRNGTVYPVTDLPDKWTWQRYDMTYWNGDDIHIEIGTAQDIPLLVKNQPRSWFGIRRAIVQPIGSPSPDYGDESLAILFGSGTNPQTEDEFAEFLLSEIRKAVLDWKTNDLNDQRALFLDACLREGFLANDIDSLSTAKPLLLRYRELEDEIPVPRRVPGLDETVGRDWPLYVRGNHKTPSDAVPRRFLEAIDDSPFETDQSGRLELAEKVLESKNPLSRRVIVNRIWHHVFGSGLVATPDNFGRLGMKPTHPELLDYLASDFSENGWSIKRLVRLLVTSQSWQRSAVPSPGVQEKDPNNELLSHANVRRLDAESIRDSIYSSSGRLENKLYGPPSRGQSPRRSVYLSVIRNSLDPFLRVFDFPEPFSATGRRNVTNVPAQSLTMLNDPMVRVQAAAWAQAIASDQSLPSTKLRVDQMFMAAFGRAASDQEHRLVQIHFADARAQIERQTADIARIRSEIRLDEMRLAETLEPVRKRLVKEATKSSRISETIRAGKVPAPIHRWDFSVGTKDLAGAAKANLQAGASVQNGGLELDGAGYLTTDAITQSLSAKTLEAWVQLDNVQQRGGGVITIQTANGTTFDSIVFGEKRAGRWLAGSNHFARTQDFNGPQETVATDQPVHIAVVYSNDGTITGYRNGKVYGRSYKSKGPVKFKAGEAVISMGVRHLPAGGNRLLSARIFKASVYDCALTAEEVALCSGNPLAFVTDKKVFESLTEQQQEKVRRLRVGINTRKKELDSVGEPPKSNELAIWTDLAQSLFTFKEFIYIR